eukprot:6511171-Alexandrium_andersonii.AAC.1
MASRSRWYPRGTTTAGQADKRNSGQPLPTTCQGNGPSGPCAYNSGASERSCICQRMCARA